MQFYLLMYFKCSYLYSLLIFCSPTFSVVLIAIMLMVAAYNGATYYMDLFNRQLTPNTIVYHQQ